MTQHPSRRRLTFAWTLLMVLTIASLMAGRANIAGPLGLTGSAVVLTVAVVKAHRILMDFLNLRAAPAGWRGVFLLWLGLVAGAIWIAAAVPVLLSR